MRKHTNLLLTFLSVVAVSWIGISSPAVLAAKAVNPAAKHTAASNTNYGQALEIAPPLVNLTVDPGQTLTTQIYLRDISNGPLIVSGEANDFVAAGEDGTPKILLGSEDANDPYSMKAWVSSPASLSLVPREIKTMAITIHVPANASPGGHYGVIRFTATPPSLRGTGVSLATSLGALILVTVNGRITHNLSVQQFSVNQNGKAGSVFQSGPLNFVEKLKNNGNVHEEPTGLVRISDMFGKELAAVGVNALPKNILPDSVRAFSEPLDKSVIGNKRLLGRYHAIMSVTYGPNKQVLTAGLTFWIIPYRLIAIVIILLVAGFFALRYFLHRYTRHVINKTNSQRR